MSLPFRGRLITDPNTSKFVHMLIIPFPVCVYAAINYKKGRQLVFVVFHFVINCGIHTNMKWNDKHVDKLSAICVSY